MSTAYAHKTKKNWLSNLKRRLGFASDRRRSYMSPKYRNYNISGKHDYVCNETPTPDLTIILVSLVSFFVPAFFILMSDGGSFRNSPVWIALIFFWLVLILLHYQLLLLRLPRTVFRVSPEYFDSLSKRRGYVYIFMTLIIAALSVAIMGAKLKWPVDSFSTFFGIAALYDIIGRDRAKFYDAIAFAAAKRLERYKFLTEPERKCLPYRKSCVSVPQVGAPTGTFMLVILSVGWAGFLWWLDNHDPSAHQVPAGMTLRTTLVLITFVMGIVILTLTWMYPERTAHLDLYVTHVAHISWGQLKDWEILKIFHRKCRCHCHNQGCSGGTCVICERPNIGVRT